MGDRQKGVVKVGHFKDQDVDGIEWRQQSNSGS